MSCKHSDTLSARPHAKVQSDLDRSLITLFHNRRSCGTQNSLSCYLLRRLHLSYLSVRSTLSFAVSSIESSLLYNPINMIATASITSSTNMFGMQTKTLIAIIFICIVMSSVIALLLAPWEWPCKPSNTRPILDEPPDQLPVHKSSDNRAMARLVGYMNFSNRFGDYAKPAIESYVPFKLQTLEQISEPFGLDEIITLSFITNCCSITMKMYKDEKNVETFRTVVNFLHDYTDKEEGQTCVIGRPGDWRFNSDFHFACYKDKYFECIGSMRQMLVGVHLQVIEFEVDSQTYATNTFSKPVFWCTG